LRFVKLRYGSFTEYSRIWNSYTEIARITNTPISTVFASLKRFRENGNKYIDNRIGRRARP